MLANEWAWESSDKWIEIYLAQCQMEDWWKSHIFQKQSNNIRNTEIHHSHHKSRLLHKVLINFNSNIGTEDTTDAQLGASVLESRQNYKPQ
jgi:hypothetical protein